MARIQPIPVDQWPDELVAFKPASLNDVERDVLGIHAHLPSTTKAFYKTKAVLAHEGSLPPRLIELVRLRIAFFNQCRSCMALRYDSDTVDENAVCSLERPEEAVDLTAAEKSALRFAELLATDHLAIDDDVYADLRKYFTEAQLVELGTAAALNVGMGRLAATWKVTDHVDPRYAQEGAVSPW
ncbi:carboxymuconolactone decarboxylase family protein [Mycolicibacterium sp.]|uniref:carboxymuconolactone decarboxylase family protein n=1 Tax=Mycolicibacterium sp. TaxID=2320850 RepID=UPI001A31872B|nr:carboxymuconolactone decarboxylase family protein [Mycolicibacterium sp.]MBJ7336813.1 carboxymuconolactone decarboxylase family protein [Mycolicibacterium sp.]